MSIDQAPAASRLRPRFSLLTLLLLTTIVAMVTALWQQHPRYAPLRDEVRKLRNEVGSLTVDDPTKPHAIEVETGEPNHWRWRVYIPEQGNYRVHCYGDHIPKNGIPKSTGSGISASLPSGEHRFDLWLAPLEANREQLLVRFSRFNGLGTRSFVLRETKNDWIFNEATRGSTYSWLTIGKASGRWKFTHHNPMRN